MKVGKGGDEVELRTIDSFGFSNVSLIKIDIEGYQAHALKGAKKTISASHPAIIVEIREKDASSDETKRILTELGYSIRQIQGPDYLALFEE